MTDTYPFLGINGEYFSREFLESVEAHLAKMAPIWAAGLDAPSPCDKFAYHVLKQIRISNKKELTTE